MIVAFDLEGTLSSGETWKALAAYLKRDGRSRTYRSFFNARFPRALLAQTGIINKREFQNRWIEELIGLFARAAFGGTPPDTAMLEMARKPVVPDDISS